MACLQLDVLAQALIAALQANTFTCTLAIKRNKDRMKLIFGWVSRISSLSCSSNRETLKKNFQANYFTSSDPHHDMLGGGCQVRVVIDDGKNGEFENIDFRFPWLSDTSEMGFGHDVPFLNYSDRLPHPSDLCQPDRVR